MIQTIEERTLNAWPSLQQILYDGWLLRFSRGYTRRANSANILYHGTQDIEPKIERCIHLYRQKKLPPVFKLTPLSQAVNLDERLAQRDFVVQAPTSVQVLNLDIIPPPETDGFEFEPAFSTAWLACFQRMKNSAIQRDIHQRILQNIVPQTCFASLVHHHQVVACGLGVLEGDTVGLFDILTHPQHRRQGFGYKLILNILHWAKKNGATQSHLSVEKENAPALRLYEKLGFEEIYTYWYRVKD